MGDARENALGNERTGTNGLGNSWESGDPGQSTGHGKFGAV